MPNPPGHQAISRRDLLRGASAAALTAAAVPLGLRLPARTVPSQPDSLSRFVAGQMRIAHVPGLAAALVRDGDVAWSAGFGWASIAHEVAVTPETVFMLASVSKTLTATALMQVKEEGLLGLDDDVNGLLPFPVRNPSRLDAPITPRMLLTHTASIRDTWSVLGSVYTHGDSPIPLGDFLRQYLTPGGTYYRTSNFADEDPGTAYAYCNTALAGYLVESTIGVPFDRRSRQRIFEPLGMRETSWHLAGLPAHDVATPYAYVPSTGGYRPYGQYGYPDYPDGQLRTSAAQLARFLSAFVDYGRFRGTRILEHDTAAEMRRDQVPAIVRGQGLIWY